MQLLALLQRAGKASPLVPAIGYVAVLTVAKLVSSLLPKSGFVAFLAVLVWFAALLLLFAVVTWIRDDDWLAAGFLLGLTILIGGVFADVVARTITSASIADAVFTGAGLSLGLLLRAIVIVPLCGGIVILVRMGTEWLMGELGRPVAPFAGTPAAKRRARAGTRR
jgi:hypothetical protein